MAIKKTASGRWQADCQPQGRGGKRVRRTFDTKAEAIRWERAQQAAADKGEWEPPQKDKRRLSELVEQWFQLHGHTLKRGEERHDYLRSLCHLMGDPLARDFTAAFYSEFRQKRLAGSLKGNSRHRGPITANTCNHDLTYLRAVFNELIRLGKWRGANPLATIRPLKFDQVELSFLDKDQINRLLLTLKESNSEHALMVSKICLATGARWGEAQGLRGEQIRNQRITFSRTKSHKSRTVPIAKELEEEIFTGRSRSGPLFCYCYKAFVRALEKAGIDLPKGQKSHVLRHTFASHFVMNGGNLLTLKEILGHSDIKMTMRYAHLAPEHLEDAVTKNPLAPLQKCQPSVNANREHRVMEGSQV
ncbi:phage integrase [Microbulbifer thermotolerans]|uniref:phage integrase n=1 Tax=Microbulbifer thermotolerans TaxID=252514 RepID=UPI00224B0FDB|nr:tyrosine-type recombinase/integrase [Microbulbifer thermotolerans]MCX2834487.1 tyrosine-type recombinase/integrase [Microbulbifer thermotolerans]